MPTLINNNGPYPTHNSLVTKYNRSSVERAMDVHNINWLNKGKGYTIGTAMGIIHLKSLREAAIFVYGCADTKRRMEAGN